MKNSEDRPPPAVGAYWIKEEEYPALLQLFDDGHKMPPSWKEWLKVVKPMVAAATSANTAFFIAAPFQFFLILQQAAHGRFHSV
jgi:hypothetical protein